MIKTNQPTAHAQICSLPWNLVPIGHTTSNTAHGRAESRSIKTMAVADNLGGLTFPHAKLAIGTLKTLGAVNIAKTTRAIRNNPEQALPILGITHNPEPSGT